MWAYNYCCGQPEVWKSSAAVPEVQNFLFRHSRWTLQRPHSLPRLGFVHLPLFLSTGVRLQETHIWLLISSRHPPQGHGETIESVPSLSKKTNCICVLPLCGRTGANWQASELNSFWKSLKTMYDRETCLPVHSRTAVLTLLGEPGEPGNRFSVFWSFDSSLPTLAPTPKPTGPFAIPAVVEDHCDVLLRELYFTFCNLPLHPMKSNCGLLLSKWANIFPVFTRLDPHLIKLAHYVPIWLAE